ncbi:MAG: RecX family transcriptional regulator [Proteobacteria bacterium]|nr:RecX family transcriptional regulator [Pseudomonadota bacterium]
MAPPPDDPPGQARLHEAALRHLARYAATAAGLTRVLDRRIARWAREAGADGDEAARIEAAAAEARRAARAVVARLVAAGAVDDAAFAAARAKRLARSGRSRRAAAAHLAARGVDAETAGAALGADGGDELASALVLARRRRIGPFRTGEAPDAEGRMRELAVLARAGFPREVAERALRMPGEEAAEIVAALLR